VDRVALADAVARCWNRAGVRYAVAHGIDEWPERLGRDLDVVVARRDGGRAVASARDVLRAHGLVVVRPPPLWGERRVAADPDAPDDLLEIHTTTAITWRNTAIVERPEPAGRVGPFAVDPWVGVAKRVVLPLLAGRVRLLRDEPARTALAADERSTAACRLADLMGAGLAGRLLAALAAGDFDALEPLARRARRAVFWRSATRHPMRAASLLCRSLARRIREPLAPCAPIVAVVGGGEAAALVRQIAHGDRLVFTDLVVRPRGGGSALGQLLRDRIDSSRQRLVLYADGPAGEVPNAHAGARCVRGLLRPAPDLTIVVGVAAAPAAPATGRGGVVTVLPAVGGDELRRRAVALIIGAFMVKHGGVWRPEHR
jgi:hypothetical protein